MLAEAIARGAGAVEGTLVTLVCVAERASHWEALDAAQAIVFGCSTYMGSGPAALKAFMEETIQPQFLEQRWKDKLAAGFAAQHGMLWITLGQLLGWQTSVGSADDPNRLASFLGLMAQSNSDQGLDLAPPTSDRLTAELFGRRISEAAHHSLGGDEMR
ncbi:MAG: hypothetical protein AVDCRST_MAG78-3759 [uncultured Rubrobacteraceae bacterium]|uniref:Flavodoxin-like domain-containing protein n=1 Tax=uncultured Rubrobacteraceae bacterium TaxID=349277 RepID=A0A6J4QXS8_9ACTN|nr:MAG: hypothetical protein AVDCRST_MAG78-3759 [uncultured Rubrobacteraceae bacterium]